MFKQKTIQHGSLVKRLRHHPFTVVTGVRFPQESPFYSSYGRIAQLGEHLPYKQGVTGSSPVVPTMRWLSSSVGQSAGLSRRRSRVRAPSESPFKICWHGSTVEQLTCNQQVVGSIPIASSNKINMEEFPSGQRGQTVNLLRQFRWFESIFLHQKKNKLSLFFFIFRNKKGSVNILILTNYKCYDKILLKIKLCNSYQERWRERAL